MAEPVLRRQSIAEQVEGILQDAESKKVAIAGSARGILQQVTNGQRGQNDLFPSGAFDLVLLSRPMANTTFYVDIEAIAGPGPDRKLGSLSRLNADVETLGLGGLGIGGQDQRLAIREAWLGFRLFKDRLDVVRWEARSDQLLRSQRVRQRRNLPVLGCGAGEQSDAQAAAERARPSGALGCEPRSRL